MPRLLVTQGHHFGVSYPLIENTSLGRSPSCTIQLLDEKASRHHATVELQGDHWVLRDEGSSNGTGLNGKRLASPTPLNPGDQLYVGSSVLVFEPDLEVLRVEEGEGVAVLASPAGVPAGAASGGAERRFLVENLLNTVAKDLESGEATFLSLLALVAEGIGARRAALLRVREGGSARAVAVYPQGERVVVPRILFDTCRQRVSPVLSADGYAELVSVPRMAGTDLKTQVGSSLGVPLVLGSDVAGMVYLDSDSSERFVGLPLHVLRIAVAAIFSSMLDGDPRRGVGSAPICRPRGEDPVANSKSMKELVASARVLASDPCPTLLRGEAGTGKGFLARWLHELSPRRLGPFVEGHCGEWLEGVADGALFGYEPRRGQDPSYGRVGLVERARGGTLFLDGVDALTDAMQVKLLRMLQERSFYRVEGARPVRADLWIIAGGDAALELQVAEGKFREDLFLLLSGADLWLPPLRRRLADIEELVKRFAHRYNLRTGANAGISSAGITHMENYDWPGNLHQLEDFVFRVLVGAEDAVATVTEVNAELQWMTMAATGDPEASRGQEVTRMERHRIGRALARSNGSTRLAAAMLGLDRADLQRRMVSLGLRHLEL